jgi:hypothetical protein
MESQRTSHLLCKNRHAAFGLKKIQIPSGHLAQLSKFKRGHYHKIKAQFIEGPLLRDSGWPNLGAFRILAK